MDAKEKKMIEPKIWHLISAVLLVIFIWASSGYFLYSFYKLQERGPIGDMFGVVNALFSGLAFAVLIFTIFLQRHELRLQRKDLDVQSQIFELTKEEIKGQRMEMRIQNDTLMTQKFENTFFQMLGLHNEIVKKLSYTWPKKRFESEEVYTGRNCLEHIYKQFHSENSLCSTIKDERLMNEVYLLFSQEFEHLLGHYFRNMYNIIKFIKNSSVVDKKLYTNLLRAQLSDPELALLFYNCLSDKGSEKFKPLVEEFALLKNLPTKILLDPGHKSFFKPYAFDDIKYIKTENFM